jgi:signal transduction histidine kinase
VTIVKSAPLPPGAEPVPVQFVVEVPDNLTAEVTKYQMVAAIIHLLTNAREALAGRTDGVARVVISADARDPDTVEIAISDNGRGICPEDLADFREFKLGLSSKKQQGRGFGLSTAAKYMTYHHGSLDINSAEGVGTVVKLMFPRKSKGV